MFSSGPNYNKLKTNLRLAVNRLKLLEKKKTETNQKARKEIADFIEINKPDRARIRVESIIREDYLVEAMEILEMFCDLILARFGLITQLKELDEGISEAVASIIWVAPRLISDVPELKIISDQLTLKYGKAYADACRAAVPPSNVSEKLQHKMSIQAPPKLLVEKYLIEIAKIFNIDYEPDQSIMKEDTRPEGFLIDFGNSNNLDGNNPGNFPPQPGFSGYPLPPQLPILPGPPPFNYPAPSNSFTGPSAPFNYNIPPMPQSQMPPQLPQQPNASHGQSEKKDLNVNFLNDQKRHESMPPPYSEINSSTTISPEDNAQFTPNMAMPKPAPRSKVLPDVPTNLPDVPADDDNNANVDDSEIDFDDLSRRFEELKKRH
ncbi:hypothetical protein PVAND_006214 [Polypedilum vanderplanki]|uniref:IST1 homolog n=1 Tax=Polypedilum vanderplanki TaxID=319348 RepID=A0A9J6C3A5_POLVA|nr:hypothetical protein PVAND_006214 [Polypedilum vanderplanki]